MKIVLTDIETTGLDPERNEIIEIGAVIFDSATLEVLEEFEIKVKPLYTSNSFFLEQAKMLNGYSEKEWEDAYPIYQALSVFSYKTKDCVFMSQNVTFDWSFLQERFKNDNIEHSLHYHHLDLSSMVFAKYLQFFTDSPDNLSLKNLCKIVGVEPEPEIHRALTGAKTAFEVYKKLV